MFYFFSDHDKWSLERAKENVEKHYTVVGVAERYEDTLWLLEKSLPRYVFCAWYWQVQKLVKGTSWKGAIGAFFLGVLHRLNF